MIANKSWADITCTAGGVPFLEIQEISYSTERKIEDHFGVGDRVVSRGYGNVMDAAPSMKMSFDELKRLEASAPFGDITLIPPFIVQIIWKPTPQNPITYTDNLYNFQFTSNGRELKQGDTKHFTTIKGIFAGLNNQ